MPRNDVVPATSSLNIETLEEELLCDNQDYLDKIELGKQIASIYKGTVGEESHTRVHKKALDMYRKQRTWIDI